MKPVAFDIVRPRTTQEVVKLLSDPDAGARVVAGSQSLGPMLNLRLVQPKMLIDLTGIAELTSIREDDAGITVGACVSTGSIEDGCLPGGDFSMLRSVAAGIAYRAVRNRGTIGGSVCHADPSADWPSAFCGFNAQCIIEGPKGRRSLPISDFITGAFATTLDTGEFLVALRIPRRSTGGRWGYQKLCRKTGEFAMAIGVVNIDPARDIFRMVFGATEGRQITIPDFRPLGLQADADPNREALAEILGTHGVTDPVAISQQAAIMTRAFQQARQ
jgi:carbon-monoxide dehydrogenase medium subunit